MSANQIITLGIETSNPSRADFSCAGVGLYAGEDAPSLREIARADLSKGSSHDDALVRAIDACARAAQIGPREINRIAVSVGPGGYTSVRIATTVAKSIALISGAACVPVPTAMGVIGALAGSLPVSSPTLLCLAWKRSETWAQVVRNGKPDGAGRILTIDDVAAFDGELVIADAAFIARVRESHAGFATRSIEPVFDPRAIAIASFACAEVSAHGLVPMYPREPEAVRVWAERKQR